MVMERKQRRPHSGWVEKGKSGFPLSSAGDMSLGTSHHQDFGTISHKTRRLDRPTI